MQHAFCLLNIGHTQLSELSYVCAVIYFSLIFKKQLYLMHDGCFSRGSERDFIIDILTNYIMFKA